MKTKNKHVWKLSIICTFFFSTYGMAQNEYRFPLSDAVKYTGNVQLRAGIVKAYTFDANCSVANLKANKFLTEIENTINSANFSGDPKVEVDSSQNFGGNPLGAPLIDALGTVIAKRFKEELTFAFLESFREKLKADSSSLGKLFPNAKNILLNDDPFNHKAWLASFRGALDEDLKLFPDNLPILLEEIKMHSKLNDSQKSILDALIAAYKPALEFTRNPQKSYASIVQFLDNLEDVDFSNQNLSASLTFSHILLKEMGNSAYNDWAEKSTLKILIGSPQTAKYFIGFTIEKHKKALQAKTIIFNESSINLYDLFHNDSFNIDNVNKYVHYFNTIVHQAISISETIITLKSRERVNPLKFEDYQPLINKSLNAISIIINNDAFRIIDSKESIPSKLSNFIEYTQSIVIFATKVNTNISSKEYSKIVVNTLTFITKYIPSQDNLDQSKALKDFIKYADLAINLTSASTSEEMVTAIESAALPSQSYRLKRNSYFSISVNSYPGAFVATEFLLNEDVKNETAPVIGFTAPIGIGFNWGIGKSDEPTKYSDFPTETVIKNKKYVDNKNYFKGHSLSLFLSVVDLGAITTFRLSDDETPVNDIQWQNVFAPGVYVVWGIGNTPLALGVGGQYGPELRNVKTVEGVATPTIDSRAFRLGISLTVDIPLLHLYAKTEKVTVK
jgi:hypothetical protein